MASVWIEAARPRTLPAGVAPVLVGTAASEAARLGDGWFGSISGWRFLAALVVAVSLQVAVNYANDYFDGVRGVDTAERVGPRRAVASGLVAPEAMKRAIYVALGVAAVAGIALAAAAGWWLLLVGAAAGLAALSYSGGRRPYASRGLGEVSVFVFFGLVATVGSQYVQDEGFVLLSVLAAVPIGAFAVALLVVNNLRDIPTDARAGKRTLAVRIGDQRTRQLFVALVGLAFVWPVVLVVTAGEGWLFLPWLASSFGYGAAVRVRAAPIGPGLIRALELTARCQLWYALLLTVGLLLRDSVPAVAPLTG